MNRFADPARCVRILTADPKAYRVEFGDRVLILHGPDSRSLDRFMAGKSFNAGLDSCIEAFVTMAEECTAILVTRSAERCARVSIWRAINSDYECFLWIDPEGGVVLSDCFRNVVAAIPPDQRTIASDAFAAHVLFRTCPGKTTLLARVQRVGHGEQLTIRFPEIEVNRRQFERLDFHHRRQSPASPQDSLEQILREAVRLVISDAEDSRVLLSGGIDSTLIAVLAGSNVPSVAAAIDSPEWAPERQYSTSAAQLLGCRHRFVETSEDTYLQRLESFIDATCLSPHHLQTVLLDDVLCADHADTYLCGEFADAMFGSDRAVTASRWRSVERVLDPMPQAISGLVSRWLIPKLATGGADFWRDTRCRASDWRGLGARAAMFTHADRARRVLGTATVANAVERRWDYAAEAGLKEVGESSGIDSHLETAHFVTLFCEGTMSVWRQSAMSRGKAIHSPYSARSVIRCLLSLPPLERTCRAGRSKYLLKDLVRRLVPGYDVDKKKLASGLPVERFLSSPLSGALATYAVHDLLPKDVVAEERLSPSWISWNVLIWRMIETRIARSSAVTTVANSSELRVPV